MEKIILQNIQNFLLINGYSSELAEVNPYIKENINSYVSLNLKDLKTDKSTSATVVVGKCEFNVYMPSLCDCVAQHSKTESLNLSEKWVRHMIIQNGKDYATEISTLCDSKKEDTRQAWRKECQKEYSESQFNLVNKMYESKMKHFDEIKLIATKYIEAQKLNEEAHSWIII